MENSATEDRLKIAESLATLATEVANLKSETSTLYGEVRSGNSHSNQQNTTILERLAVLTSKSEDSTKYQDECDKDRALIKETFRAEVNEIKESIVECRLAIKGFSVRNAVISAFIAGSIAAGTLFAEIYRHG